MICLQIRAYKPSTTTWLPEATSKGECAVAGVLNNKVPNAPRPVCRYVPSQADVAVFTAVAKAPNAKYVNVLRWYNHINSYSDDEKLV